MGDEPCSGPLLAQRAIRRVTPSEEQNDHFIFADHSTWFLPSSADARNALYHEVHKMVNLMDGTSETGSSPGGVPTTRHAAKHSIAKVRHHHYLHPKRGPLVSPTSDMPKTNPPNMRMSKDRDVCKRSMMCRSPFTGAQ